MSVSGWKRSLLGALGVVCTLVLVGCASSGVIEGQGPEITYKREAYVIGIGDQLRVDVWRNQELTRDLIVRPDGLITMPLMGDMQAEGETPEELAAAISNELGVIIISPEVSVTVTNPVSVAYQYRVRAMGQVNEAVSIAFVDGMTVVDLTTYPRESAFAEESRARGAHYISPQQVFAQQLKTQFNMLTGLELPETAFERGMGQ